MVAHYLMLESFSSFNGNYKKKKLKYNVLFQYFFSFKILPCKTDKLRPDVNSWADIHSANKKG